MMAPRPPDEGLPVLRLSARQFRELGEYSCTMPTGAYPGKRWRRLDGAYDVRFLKNGGRPRWIVGEYYELPDPAHVGIRWFKPVVVVGTP